MTEADWLACTDPAAMLDFLEGRLSERKLRLFACACCRRIWPLLTSPDSRHAIEVSERFADGRAPQLDLAGALIFAARSQGGQAGQAAYLAASRKPLITTREASAAAIEAAAEAATAEAHATAANRDAWAAVDAALGRARAAEAEQQAALLRDLLGNPFRPVVVEPSWLSGHGGTVPRMARLIYDERRFSDLPILADALEEAGYSNAALLAHLRQGIEHVLGCWALDQCRGEPAS
jgi:hypothetical protein